MFDNNQSVQYREKSKKATGNLVGYANHYERMFKEAGHGARGNRRDAWRDLADSEGFEWRKIPNQQMCEVRKEVGDVVVLGILYWGNPFGQEFNAVPNFRNESQDGEDQCQ